MKYVELMEKHRKEFEGLPIKYAYSMSQFEEMLEEFGLTMEEAKEKLYKSSGGAFYMKKDAELIHETLSRIDEELVEFMKDPDQAYDAFLYEMRNHEYPINGEGEWEVLSCFGLDDSVCKYNYMYTADDYMEKMGFGKEIVLAFHRAEYAVIKEYEDNGW